MSFELLGLRAELLKAIKTKGYFVPTPVQNQVIPVILDGQDVLVRAETGTGKTDAFALPLVENLSRISNKDHTNNEDQVNNSNRFLRALVLTPTRELALQVGDSIKAYARRVSIRCTVVYGGVRTQPQIDRLQRGVDILVATPGRLLDLADQRYLNLSKIEFLIFDEADRMLDMGFSNEISRVLDLVPAKRRTMLFSATYSQQIKNLAGKMLHKPKYIEISSGNTAAKAVIQKVHLVKKTDKRALLIHLVKTEKWTQVLVFIRTKHGANKLVSKLAAEGINAAALHSNKSQSFRIRTLQEFKKGEIRILVATDVAARGLDISNLPYVINYNMPNVPEDYIHRIGRTGRAGVSGIAISFVDKEEKVYLKAIEKLLKQKIPVEKIDGYTEDSTIPDYVLYRPDNKGSGEKIDKDIKEIADRQKVSKRLKLDKGLKLNKSIKSDKGLKTNKNSKSDKSLKSDKSSKFDRDSDKKSGRKLKSNKKNNKLKKGNRSRTRNVIFR